MERLKYLSDRYDVPETDVLMIALNAFGIRNSLDLGRARCHILPEGKRHYDFRTIVATGRSNSPFNVVGDILHFENTEIGKLTALEHDDARLGYFRNQKRVLTLNTNARSTCTGCVFCPNTGTVASDPKVDPGTDELLNWLGVLCERSGMNDLSTVNEVNISTSCFEEEVRAIDHLKFVRKTLGEFGFEGRLGILSSVIRSKAGLEELSRDVGPFALFLTLECVTDRDLWLKETKASLDATQAIQLLQNAQEVGCSTGVNLVVGLDPIDELTQWLSEAIPFLSDFPNLQVFQVHSNFMEPASVMGGNPLEWFLEARLALEECLKPFSKTLRPEHWQNYRPLWYTRFLGERLF